MFRAEIHGDDITRTAGRLAQPADLRLRGARRVVQVLRRRYPVTNTRRLRQQAPDADELVFRAELVKGSPGCGSTTVTARFRGRWEYTLRCRSDCPSWTGALSGFTGHTIGSKAACRAGTSHQAIDGTTGGVVVAAGAEAS